MKRQQVRKLVLLISLLLFPITMYYLSPYVIIMGAMEGIVTGSFVVFLLMILAGIVAGRGFCAYICPAGSMQEACMAVNDKRVKNKWGNYIKYIIWGVWILVIVICFVLHGSIDKVEFTFMTDHGISISEIGNYIIYYLVIVLIIAPAILMGRRTFCHCFCWMSPFMIIGMKIRKLLHLPGLRVKAEKEKCISCGKCTKSCPMSLPVQELLKEGQIMHSECINCGMCIDTCPKKVLRYGMTNEKKEQ